jgi:hypothetical protein
MLGAGRGSRNSAAFFCVLWLWVAVAMCQAADGETKVFVRYIVDSAMRMRDCSPTCWLIAKSETSPRRRCSRSI